MKPFGGCSSLLGRLPEPPRKVALVRASRIGDFLCATPAFRALRAALPEAEISLIALPFVRELAERLPSLDRFIPFPGFPGIAEQFFDARQATAFFARMQAERFDLAIQMHGSGVNSNPFTLLLGARVTAGFIRPGDGAGRLDAALPLPEREGGHERERVLALVRFLGAPEPPREGGLSLDLPLLPEDHAEAAALLGDAVPPFIALHPGAREPAKRWPPERFALVGQRLQAECGGTILVVGGVEERDFAAEITSCIGADARNIAGQTSLPVLGALLTRCALLVTNDSGPAHMAYAVGTPTVTLFGNTDPARWGPLRTEPHRLLDGRGDITAIKVDEVVEAALTLLALPGLS